MITLRQEKFILEYIKTGNATQSALSVGYKGRQVRKTAYDLLHRPDISLHIEEIRGRIEAEGIADSQEIQTTLTGILRDKALNEKGVPIQAPRIQAADILNKMNKRYQDSIININDIKIQIVYEDTLEIGEGDAVQE